MNYCYRQGNQGLEVVGKWFYIKTWFFGSVTSKFAEVNKTGRLKLVRYLCREDDLEIDDIWQRKDDKGHWLKKDEWKVR